MKTKRQGRRLRLTGIVLLAGFIAVTVGNSVTEAKDKGTTVEKPIVLVFSSHNPNGGFWHKHVVEPYFLELEKRTGGRIKIEQHWNGELVGLMDAYDAMARGIVDMAEYFPSMLTGRFPMDDIEAFNPVNTHCYRPGRVLLELGREFPQMNEPYKDNKLLFKEPSWSIGIGTTRKRLYDLEHSIGVPTLYPIAAALGVNPIWFLLMTVVAVNLGALTPPFGINLFVLGGLQHDMPMATIYKRCSSILFNNNCGSDYHLFYSATHDLVARWVTRFIHDEQFLMGT